MTRILAYRFSAFGDVAMAAPVIKEFLRQNPDAEVIMVSRRIFADLFSGIERLQFHGIKVDDYKGLRGMRQLSTELCDLYSPNAVADLHDVIRTKMLNVFYKKRGIKVAKIDKGKKEKERLTDVNNLNKHPLRSTVERYADVFRSLGFTVDLPHTVQPIAQEKSGVGFAPFAQHRGKMLPLEKSFELVRLISQKEKVYFFGASGAEAELLETWQKRLPNTVNLAGKLSLEEELGAIAKLRVMISMDSANMHLASLVGTRAVSVWGSTHRFAGFLGYGQSEADVVEVKDLTCRPCSAFGDRPCYRGDYACLNELRVQQIIEKL